MSELYSGIDNASNACYLLSSLLEIIYLMLELNRIDLNLLVALQTLLEESNVTRAAQRLGVTQPAMSRTLTRLRSLFDDPLFVRTAQGLAATPRALELAPRLNASLADIAGLVRPAEFDPATSQRTWRIATTDYGANSMLPLVLERLHREAPGVNLEITYWRKDGYGLLESNAVELALGTVENNTPAGIHGRGLGDDHLVCLLRQDHPAIAAGLTPESFAALPHILIDVGGSDPRGLVDFALEKQGLKRQVAMRLPHFMAALAMAARTDMLVSVPQTLARLYGAQNGLAICPMPIAIPPFRYALLWHQRLHYDPGHTWLRSLFFEEITRALGVLE